MSAPLHVVFGAGQVGSQLARALARRGLRVRVVRRSASPVGDGIEVVAADARDRDAAAKAAEGAAVVYHCMNPATYSSDAWEAEFPQFGEAVVHAAVTNGARLVCLDNLYAYGPVEGVRNESTPLGATGRKARTRIAWDARLRQAARDQGLRFSIGRAGDFFGPGTGDHSFMSPSGLGGLLGWRGFWLVGDPDVPHAFSFVPDVVEGLAALGTAGPEVEGEVYHLPVVEVTPRELVTRIATSLGVPARARRVPMWLLKLLMPVVPLFAEIRETLYQWDRPFLVDDRKVRKQFPGLGTSLDDAAAATAVHVRELAAAS